MLNHKTGHEKTVKIVFVKKSKDAFTVIKKIEIMGIEGEQGTNLPNIGCTECPIVYNFNILTYYVGLHIWCVWFVFVQSMPTRNDIQLGKKQM